MTRLFIGLDPGKSGGIVVLDERSEVVHTLPLEKATEADIAGFLAFRPPLSSWRAALERASARPGQGVSSMFNFGVSYGFLRGCLAALGVPREFVTPLTWQRAMGCLSGGDKAVTRQKAEELWPGYRWTNALADSALIAEWCRRKWCTESVHIVARGDFPLREC